MMLAMTGSGPTLKSDGVSFWKNVTSLRNVFESVTLSGRRFGLHVWRTGMQPGCVKPSSA